MSELFEQPLQSKADRVQVTRDIFDQMAKQKFAYALGEHDTPHDTVQALLNDAENRAIMEKTGQTERVRVRLLACGDITDKEDFANAVFEVMKPLLDWEYSHFSELSPGYSDEKRVVANEMLNYDIQGDSLRIHIFTGGLGDLNRYLEGLSQVAEVVAAHSEVTTVDAISWIVAKHPKILEKKMGFIVQRENDGKPTVQVFDGQEVGYAYMTREDFLTKYLPKK